MPPVATRRYVSSILTSDLKEAEKEVEMIQDIIIWKILEALLVLLREIFGRTLPTGLNETEYPIFDIKKALSEV